MAVPLLATGETMRPLPIVAIDGTPDAVLGAAVIRGEPIPVIDAGRLLGVSTASTIHRFVTVRTGTRTIALAVDAVLGIIQIPLPAIRQLPPLLGSVSSSFLAAIATVDKEFVALLEASRLVPEGLLYPARSGDPPS
jgi:chemotaxis signal transduction protein